MTDAHAFLDDDDLEVIAGCLAATVNGPFFPEWEFHTLFGLVRSEVAEVAAAWPSLPRLTPDWCASPEAFQRKAVNNAVNNLLGYPHGHHGERFLQEVGFDEARVAATYARWRGTARLDGSPRGYFDRMA